MHISMMHVSMMHESMMYPWFMYSLCLCPWCMYPWWMSEYILFLNLKQTNVRMKYLYWKLYDYFNILEYSSSFYSFYTLTHLRTNVQIYSYKQIWHKRMSECNYLWPIYSNISECMYPGCMYIYIYIWSWIRMRMYQFIYEQTDKPILDTCVWWVYDAYD